jgi:hypothetical protein
MTTNIKGLLASIFIMSTVALASAQDKNVTLAMGGVPALELKVPAAAKVTFSNDYINIRTTSMSLHIWAVPKAKTVNDAVPRAAKLIKSEFINFKIRSQAHLPNISPVRGTRPMMAIRATRRSFSSW